MTSENVKGAMGTSRSYDYLNFLRPTRPLQLLFVILIMSSATLTMAGPDERAKRMHDRLTGVVGEDGKLADMSTDIAGGNGIAAAYRAMDHHAFYGVTLRNLFTPATNRDFDVFAEFNDYTATVIGMIRDDVAFDTVLSADVLYVGAALYVRDRASPSALEKRATHREQQFCRIIRDLQIAYIPVEIVNFRRDTFFQRRGTGPVAYIKRGTRCKGRKIAKIPCQHSVFVSRHTALRITNGKIDCDRVRVLSAGDTNTVICATASNDYYITHKKKSQTVS